MSPTSSPGKKSTSAKLTDTVATAYHHHLGVDGLGWRVSASASPIRLCPMGEAISTLPSRSFPLEFYWVRVN